MQITQTEGQRPASSIDLVDAAEGGADMFQRAAWWACNARMWRRDKLNPTPGFSAGKCEALARDAERNVREIALRCEIHLQRRQDNAGMPIGGRVTP